MTPYQNPLIQENAIDTLTHVETIIAFLQDFHLASSQPEAPDGDAHDGLFWVCRFVRQALEYELERMERG